MDRRETLKALLRSTNALLEAMTTSVNAPDGGVGNVGRWSSFKLFMRKYNALAQEAAPLLTKSSLLDLFDLDKVLSSSNYTWPHQKELFDSAFANTSLLRSLLESAIGYAEDEAQNLKSFIQANLRRAVFTLPEKELEIQNAVESLIVGRGLEKGNDYDRETGRVKSSGKESIPDFVFPKFKLCLEVKLAKTEEKRQVIVDEINADIRAYSKLYERQLFLVYDLGNIRDEKEFKQDLESAPGVSVLIIKH